jgi:glycosyltransferase involved in cell wall biosynthesis
VEPGAFPAGGARPALSVIICTRNRPEKLKRAVASVLASTFTDFELIVVDQSTDRRSADAVRSFGDDRVIYLPTAMVGVAISRNIGVHLSRADVVVFTDDDCIVDRSWLEVIRSEFAADPTVLGVYGRVVPYGKSGDGSLTDVVQSDGMICPALNLSRQRRTFSAPALPHLALGGGNNMSFRKETFWKAGLFFECLGPGSRIGTGEDTEFSYRLLSRRCKLLYCPAAVVQHDNWLDRSQFSEMMKVAVRAKAAVFVSHVLRLDGLAFGHLLETGWHLARDRYGIGSRLVGLGYFVCGLVRGLAYLVARPPTLRAGITWKIQKLNA